MPRANRYFVPSQIWHITHRCHNRDFLFKFGSDRKRWLHWLYEAKKRFNISILNYIVTSNHVHLLVADAPGDRNIPAFMQLVQGRTAQEYNLRINRKGAFWEDRYHATAVESGDHVIQCMGYINMNMVRAGKVDEPVQWKESGYYEIMYPRQRYAIIDYAALIKMLNIETMDQLQKIQQEYVSEILESKNSFREKKWTEAIAVGSEAFTKNICQQLGFRAKFRSIKKSGVNYELSESVIPYNEKFY